MLDLALIRAEPARVKAALARRGVPPDAVDAVVDLDRRWSARHEVREALRTRRRQISNEVARRRAGADADAPADDDAGERPNLIRSGRGVARDLRAVDHAMGDLADRRQAALLDLPNLPATNVPDTPPPVDEAGPPWPHPFPPLAHWDLLEMLHLAETAGASAGSGYLLWRGPGARLVRGLTAFLLDAHTRTRGREEVLAPPVATRWALTGSAHLPTLEGMLYEVADPSPHEAPGATGGSSASESRTADTRATNLFLAPRAEPHLAALYADTVLDEADLPVRLAAAATAFRRDSHGGGAAGRGLLRLRAFPTVEVYTLCRPEDADAELDAAVTDAEDLLGRLGLAHRRRLRAAADLSHAAARTVSLDVWCPGLPQHDDDDEASETGRWVEVAALSSFTDYQARRVGARYKDDADRVRPVHTVGGASVALPRLVAAILETGQQADGSIRLPEALVPLVGTEVVGAPEPRA